MFGAVRCFVTPKIRCSPNIVSFASRVCSIEKGVVCISKLLFKADEEKFSIGRVAMNISI